MNIDQVKALAEILDTHGLTRVEVCEGETRIMLERFAPMPAPFLGSAPIIDSVSVMPGVKDTADHTPAEKNSASDVGDFTVVRAPIVGVFYSAPSPDSDPFVTIGSKVKAGDVLCIIEAMKMMNEIVAEADGEIADICLKNGDIAEYGQVLFKIL